MSITANVAITVVMAIEAMMTVSTAPIMTNISKIAKCKDILQPHALWSSEPL